MTHRVIASMDVPEILTPRLRLRAWSDADVVALAEVGWVIVRDLWGQGLATEAGSAALEFGFATKGLRRIISIAHRENAASQKVMEKLGLVREGETIWRDAPVIWYAIDA